MKFEPFPQASYLDQFAHTLAGFLMTWLFLYIGVFWWFAIFITLCLALTREMIQHPMKIGAGSRTDLVFWTLGCALGAMVCA